MKPTFSWQVKCTPLIAHVAGGREEATRRTRSAPGQHRIQGDDMQSLIRQFITAGALSFVALVTAVQAQSDASTIYKARCAMCHSADGSADTQIGKTLHAKDLRSEEVQKMSDADISGVITKGNGAMPSFGSQLSPEDIHKLVDYVRDLGKRK